MKQTCYNEDNFRNAGLLEGIKMAFVISSDCINCGACESACPVGCIAPGAEIFVIDPDACIDCAGCVDACPVDAIGPA